jgi:DNA (cytosine-5)-methyltransferase 1
MNYLSVCSGIEAATVAWHDMGWKPLAFSEIEKFPSEVLKHHYPDVPNLGDMTKFKEWDFGTTRLDLLVGGTPCQAFSVAGLRKGLEDPRGNLALTYVAILNKFRPKWCVWENVPGVLSSNGGKDFGSFLTALGELGYGWAYRVLDAQYFGVAQRRKRVFVVGCFGNWESAAKVLFESDCLRRNTAKGKIQGKEIAATITARFGNSRNNHEELAPIWPAKTASTLNASFGSKLGLENQHINSGAPLFVPSFWDGGQTAETLTCSSNLQRMPDKKRFQAVIQATAFDAYNSSVTGNITKTLDTGSDYHHVPNVYSPTMAVRRLTEVECERLQGFSDNYTNIKKNCPSGARYKALGNSMAVPVMKWIGNRINDYERGNI